MSLEVLIPKGFADTSTILVEEYLKPLGVDAYAAYTFKQYPPPQNRATARVCWGISGRQDGLRELNPKASTFNKLDELRKFRRTGIPCPRFWEDGPPEDESLYPILGRSTSHSEGKGIHLYNSLREAQTGSSYFYTKVIPSEKEFRIWVYRTKTLGVYLRVKRWPVRKEGFGRNWWNGWAYDRVTEDEVGYPATAVNYAKDAIEAVGLDFAGVDILKGEDGRYYVLEVNTAPGAENYCRLALEKLANNIKLWYEEN